MKWLLVTLFALIFSSVHGQSGLKSDQSAAPQEIKGLYQFKGKLNGKIPVFLWFVANGTVLKGEITYLNTRARKPIPIVGEITLIDDFSERSADKVKSLFAAKIYEFNRRGYISRIYFGAFKDNRFEGRWSKPGSSKELRYKLVRSYSSLLHVDTTLSPTSIAGEYLYRFGENGLRSDISVKQIDKENFLISAGSPTLTPGRNILEISPSTVHIPGNSFIYSIPNTDCKVQINLYNNFAIIYSKGGFACGFGANATASVIYFKTSNKAEISE